MNEDELHDRAALIEHIRRLAAERVHQSKMPFGSPDRDHLLDRLARGMVG